MIRILLWILLIYFVYRFIFDFILPLTKVTGQMKQQVNQFREQQSAANNHTSNTNQKEKEKVKPGEYIDFEEIKE